MVHASDGPAIDLRYVAKTYRRRVHALRGIEMRVEPGEVFGLLGPNGAGKSTLVKILMTVIRPTRATGTLLGRPIGHKPTLARVGYLPENHRFPPYLTGRQVLEFYAAMACVDRRTRRRRAGELLESVRMGKWANVRVGTYSKGMQQRIGLAQALCHDPRLVLLDEPTDGLDPVGRRETRELLLQLRDQGKTVFLNSHLLGEVERVCDRVAILVQGKVVRQGTIDDLTAHGRRYEIELSGDPAGGLRAAIRAALPCTVEPPAAPPPVAAGGGGAARAPAEKGVLHSGTPVELDGSVVRIGTDDAAEVQPVIDALRSRNLVIRAVRPIRQSLEDFFIEAVSDVSNGHSSGPSRREGGLS
ncbi:MAG: ABC transporter ATP-binding protein [Pirellulales bacterium]|nr:ABC transporter ATP-binding protein [Pirellulales bacterium]